MDIVKKVAFFVVLASLTLPTVVFAQFQNPLKSGLGTVAGFTEAFLKAVVFIMFPIAVVFVIYSGFLFVAAQGNSDELAKAKRNFFWTVIGVGLLLGAWALAVLIKGTIDPILG
jgi:hypothetical protein